MSLLVKSDSEDCAHAVQRIFGLKDQPYHINCACYFEVSPQPSSTDPSPSGPTKRFSGRLFLTPDFICFHANSIARVIKVCLPLREITAIKEHNTLFRKIALVFHTNFKKYVFTDFLNKDVVFRKAIEQWKLVTIKSMFGEEVSDIIGKTHRIALDVEKYLREKHTKSQDLLQEHSNVSMFLLHSFHLPPEEILIEAFACRMEDEKSLGWSGRLFVTQNYCCFASSRFHLTSRIEVIRFENITSIDKKNMAMILPNSIQIFTHNSRLMFSSFFNRNQAFQVLSDALKNAQVNNAARRFTQESKRNSLLISSGSDGSLSSSSDSETSSSSSIIAEPAVNALAHSDGGFLLESPEKSSKVLDRYGFEIPTNCHYLAKEWDKEYKKIFRQQKVTWDRYRQTHNLELAIRDRDPELDRIVRKGIPLEYRGELWFNFTGARDKMQSSSIEYKELYARQSRWSREIGKDLQRTFPSHPYYKQAENLETLRRVLVAYSNRNPAIGYCQSMNFIAGMLLLFMPEERAFWVLTTVVEDCMQEYYTESMIGSQVDQKVFEELLQQRLPHLYTHFDNQIPIGTITTKWFMCLFLQAMPTETVLRVWDCFFLLGSPIIMQVGLALIKMHESSILEIKESENLFQFLLEIGRTCFDADKLLKIAFKQLGPLDRRQLNNYRTKFWIPLQDHITSEAKSRDLYFLKNNTKFSEDDLEVWWREYEKEKVQNRKWKDVSAVVNLEGLTFLSFCDIIQRLLPNRFDEVSDTLLTLFQFLDKNSDGCLDFRQLVHGINTLFKGGWEDKIFLFFGMHSFDGDFLTAEDLSKLFICCQRMYALDADWITEAQRVVAGIEDINFSKLRDLVQEAEPLKAALDRRYELDVKRLTRKLTMVVDPDRPNIIRSLSESKPVALSESEDTHEVSPP